MSWCARTIEGRTPFEPSSPIATTAVSVFPGLRRSDVRKITLCSIAATAGSDSDSDVSTTEPSSWPPTPSLEHSTPQLSPRVSEANLLNSVEDSAPGSRKSQCHIKCSREKLIQIASEIACNEGLPNVGWARDFSALHLAAKRGSTDHVHQLLKDAQGSAALDMPDKKNNLTPIDYALRDSLIDPCGEQRTPIDLKMLDLLCPQYSEQALVEQALESDTRGGAAKRVGGKEEPLGRMHIRGVREKILHVASEIACNEGLSNVNWARDFSALHLAAKHGSKDYVLQLLKDASASSTLRTPDWKNNLTPIDYALRGMLKDANDGQKKPIIDLQMLDLLSPEFSEQALEEFHMGGSRASVDKS